MRVTSLHYIYFSAVLNWLKLAGSEASDIAGRLPRLNIVVMRSESKKLFAEDKSQSVWQHYKGRPVSAHFRVGFNLTDLSLLVKERSSDLYAPFFDLAVPSGVAAASSIIPREA